MAHKIVTGAVENHREREKGVLVYPVYSRRSGGLSVGINLFPDKKICPFNCPYCEIFPFSTDAVFSLEQMEEDLRTVVAFALKQNIPVKDICFSGNGESSLSPDFSGALEKAASVRDETVPDAELVLISNGAGLSDEKIFSMLRNAVFSYGLNIWLKLDAGTPGWYQKMNRSEIPYDKLVNKIKEFAACTPVTIQTMLCAADGKGPSPEENQAWEKQVLELVEAVRKNCGNIRKVQIYGKARSSPEDPKTTPLPDRFLEERAASLRGALALIFGLDAASGVIPPPVEIYP